MAFFRRNDHAFPLRGLIETFYRLTRPQSSLPSSIVHFILIFDPYIPVLN